MSFPYSLYIVYKQLQQLWPILFTSSVCPISFLFVFFGVYQSWLKLDPETHILSPLQLPFWSSKKCKELLFLSLQLLLWHYIVLLAVLPVMPHAILQLASVWVSDKFRVKPSWIMNLGLLVICEWIWHSVCRGK